MSTATDFLTPRQRQILQFIGEFIERNGYAPTDREIAAAFGLASKTGPRKHLLALESAGFLTLDPQTARGLRLRMPVSGVSRRARPKVPDHRITLPVLGQVAAGIPIGADIGIDLPEEAEQLQVDPYLFSPRPDYLLRVKGDSMRDEAILDGDLVAIARTTQARDGQIVVARIDGELTIKALQLGKRSIKLLPRNPDYPVIRVPAGADFAVEGVFCGLIRRGY